MLLWHSKHEIQFSYRTTFVDLAAAPSDGVYAVGTVSTTDLSPAVSDLVLEGDGLPNSSALYFQGTTQVGGGAGSTFGDGLRCAGGAIVRLRTVTNVGGASQYPAVGDPSVSVRGQIAAPGTRAYQVWYRNAAAFCTSDTFNLTNGVQVTWTN